MSGNNAITVKTTNDTNFFIAKFRITPIYAKLSRLTLPIVTLLKMELLNGDYKWKL